MDRNIIIDSVATPDMPPYRDHYLVLDDLDNIIQAGPCSATPDAYKIDHAQPDSHGLPWDQCFGWCAPGSYPYTVIDSPKHGKCISINNGAQVVTRNPNATHNGAHYAEAVEMHCGYSATWQGSMACITIPPVGWDAFIGLFEIGDTGTYTIREATA
jgi:hypothetical protein